MPNKVLHTGWAPPSNGGLEKPMTYITLFVVVYWTVFYELYSFSIFMELFIYGLGLATLVDRFIGLLKFRLLPMISKRTESGSLPIKNIFFLFVPVDYWLITVVIILLFFVLSGFYLSTRLKPNLLTKPLQSGFIPPSGGSLDKPIVYVSLAFGVLYWLYIYDAYSVVNFIELYIYGLGLATVIDRFAGAIKYWVRPLFDKDEKKTLQSVGVWSTVLSGFKKSYNEATPKQRAMVNAALAGVGLYASYRCIDYKFPQAPTPAAVIESTSTYPNGVVKKKVTTIYDPHSCLSGDSISKSINQTKTK